MSARPSDSQQRADALRRFFVPDAPEEQPLDRVVRLAGMLFAVGQAALITIESGDRRLVASRGLHPPAGTAPTGNPASTGLRTALQVPLRGEKIPFYTEDAAADPRFEGHPLRHHDSVRFYASAPLKSPEGYTIGVLKLFDRVPRELSDDGLTLLTDLAAMAESDLRARRQVAAAEARAERSARRDAFARAVGTTAERFLRADDWQQEAAQALQLLGEAVGAQAVQVYVNHHSEGRLVAERSFAWNTGGSAAPAMLDYDADGLQRWADRFQQGHCLCASRAALPDAERPLLDRKQARGIAAAPLTVEAAWAGFLCFDFAREALALDPTEEDALRAAADAFGAVLERDRRMQAAARTALLDAAPTPLFVCVDEAVAFANPAAERLVGRAAPLPGTRFFDLVPTEMHAEVQALLDAGAPEDSTAAPLRVRLLGPNRLIRVVDLRAALTVFRGEPATLVCAHDVTAHTEAQQSARDARAAAEASADLVSTLMTGLNQEVRTPLTSILGYAELLAGSLSGGDLDQLGVIRKSGQQLSRIIEAVYELARQGRSTGTLTPEPLALGPLLADAERAYAPLAHERGIRFLLKPPADDTTVHADRRAITRVLGQLLTNAIQFTESGYVEVRVRTSGVRVRIEIEDTGCGIDAELLPVARLPFRRARRTDARPAGAGLGLTLADLLVNRMHGSLDLQSRPGQGTLCRVTLPMPPTSDYRPPLGAMAADGAPVETPVPHIALPSLAPPVRAR